MEAPGLAWSTGEMELRRLLVGFLVGGVDQGDGCGSKRGLVGATHRAEVWLII